MVMKPLHLDGNKGEESRYTIDNYDMFSSCKFSS